MGEKEQGSPEGAASRSGGFIKMGSVEGERWKGATSGDFGTGGGDPQALATNLNSSKSNVSRIVAGKGIGDGDRSSEATTVKGSNSNSSE